MENELMLDAKQMGHTWLVLHTSPYLHVATIVQLQSKAKVGASTQDYIQECKRYGIVMWLSLAT